MRNFKKISSLFLALVMCLSLCVPAFAADTNIANAEKNVDVIMEVTATNLTTGEQKTTEIFANSIVPANMGAKNFNDEEQEYTVGCDVFLSLDNGEIQPLNADGSSTTQCGVTATLNATYTLRYNNEDIKITNFSGGWTPSSPLFYLTDQEVGITNGGFWGDTIRENPTSNSFSYDTGWDYVPRQANGNYQARAWSDAVVYVAGMEAGGGYDLGLTLKIASF